MATVCESEGTVMTESLVITRVTHSCHLIQIGGLTVLTDPWFTQRPLYHQGEPIALQPEQLNPANGAMHACSGDRRDSHRARR
jgi:L-ascorbate metabolism protein UlaG (beta-lactamase superfamily)